MAYCKRYDEHTWTPVVAGDGYDPDYNTRVCVKCECYTSVRKAEPEHTARPAHEDTMIGRRNA